MYKASANILIACSFLWLTACSSAGVVTEDLIPTDYVNPFIGASTSVGAAGVYHGLGKHSWRYYSLRYGTSKSQYYNRR